MKGDRSDAGRWWRLVRMTVHGVPRRSTPSVSCYRLKRRESQEQDDLLRIVAALEIERAIYFGISPGFAAQCCRGRRHIWQ
jgi:hypothetical protein